MHADGIGGCNFLGMAHYPGIGQVPLGFLADSFYGIADVRRNLKPLKGRLENHQPSGCRLGRDSQFPAELAEIDLLATQGRDQAYEAIKLVPVGDMLHFSIAITNLQHIIRC